MLAHPSEDQSLIVQNVLQMGFDPTWVANLVENRFLLTGTLYPSESELISDLLQSGWGASSSAAGSRGRPDSQLGWGVFNLFLTTPGALLGLCWGSAFTLPSLELGGVMSPSLPFLCRLSNEGLI